MFECVHWPRKIVKQLRGVRQINKEVHLRCLVIFGSSYHTRTYCEQHQSRQHLKELCAKRMSFHRICFPALFAAPSFVNRSCELSRLAVFPAVPFELPTRRVPAVAPTAHRVKRWLSKSRSRLALDGLLSIRCDTFLSDFREERQTVEESIN